jgi:hypothetical protein
VRTENVAHRQNRLKSADFEKRNNCIRSKFEKLLSEITREIESDKGNIKVYCADAQLGSKRDTRTYNLRKYAEATGWMRRGNRSVWDRMTLLFYGGQPSNPRPYYI